MGNRSAAGKAHFELGAKYKKNATIPTGDTEFDFPDGGLTFQSDAYEWLVVDSNGIDAQFKGWGKINQRRSAGA